MRLSLPRCASHLSGNALGASTPAPSPRMRGSGERLDPGVSSARALARQPWLRWRRCCALARRSRCSTCSALIDSLGEAASASARRQMLAVNRTLVDDSTSPSGAMRDTPAQADRRRASASSRRSSDGGDRPPRGGSSSRSRRASTRSPACGSSRSTPQTCRRPAARDGLRLAGVGRLVAADQPRVGEHNVRRPRRASRAGRASHEEISREGGRRLRKLELALRRFSKSDWLPRHRHRNGADFEQRRKMTQPTDHMSARSESPLAPCVRDAQRITSGTPCTRGCRKTVAARRASSPRSDGEF